MYRLKNIEKKSDYMCVTYSHIHTYIQTHSIHIPIPATFGYEGNTLFEKTCMHKYA